MYARDSVQCGRCKLHHKAHHPIFVTVRTLYAQVAHAHWSYFAAIRFSTWWQHCPGQYETAQLWFKSLKKIVISHNLMRKNRANTEHGWSFLERICQPLVFVLLQMEYTLKGYAFVCTHTLDYAYKNEGYMGLKCVRTIHYKWVIKTVTCRHLLAYPAKYVIEKPHQPWHYISS